MGLPAYGFKDQLNPEIEYKKLVILENAIAGATRGVKNAVFDEGHFSVRQDADNIFSVVLSATGYHPSLAGVVNGSFFEANSLLVWDNLERGNAYYLYAGWTRYLPENRKKIRLFSATVQKKPQGKALLVAKVDLRKEDPDLLLNPDGKVYSADLASHASDSKNPHGPVLEQDEIKVRRKLQFLLEEEVGRGSPIEIEDQLDDPVPIIKTDGEVLFQDKRSIVKLTDKDNSAFTDGDSIVGAVNKALESRAVFVDFSSAGENGVRHALPEIEGRKIIGVNVQRVWDGDFSKKLGEVAVSIEGDEFEVFNSGEEGVPLTAAVFYG